MFVAEFGNVDDSGKQEFIKAMNSKEVLAIVLGDVLEAQVSGVSKSPTLFVNGRRLVGMSPETELKQILARTGADPAEQGVVRSIDQGAFRKAVVVDDVFAGSKETV